MTRTARIAALLGGDLQVREVYRVKRGVVAPEDLPKPGGKLLAPGRIGEPKCWRCGSTVSSHGRGVQSGLTILTRIRGTLARGVQVRVLHVGCVPGEDGVPLGLPARKVPRMRRHG
jgi:hypothetical protein